MMSLVGGSKMQGGYWRMYRVGRFSPYGSLLGEPNSLGADKHLPNYALPETGLAS